MNPPLSTDSESPADARTLRGFWPALAACMLVGLCISLLPHGVLWKSQGGPFWVATVDELKPYLASSAGAFHNHPFRVGDPTLAEGGFSMFPWLQLGPPVLIAKASGLGPEFIPLVWRAVAGVVMPLGFFLLIWQILRRPWVASALTSLLLLDFGLVAGLPLYQHARFFLTALRHGPEALGDTLFYHQWRIITPGLSLIFLLLFLWLLFRAQQSPTRPRILLAGTALGILVWAYFYYWTAAFLGLGILWLADSAGRRLYFQVGLVGAIVGTPQVIESAWIKQQAGVEWLQRSNKFIPVDRFENVGLPTFSTLLLCLIVGWCVWRHRDLRILAAMVVAGFLLQHHEIVTGQEIENFHWNYMVGPLTCLLFGLMGVRELDRKAGHNWVCASLSAVLMVLAASGFALHYWEVTSLKQTREISRQWQQFREQRGSGFGLAPRAVVAGEGYFPEFAVALENTRSLIGTAWYSPLVTDHDMDERRNLNRLLEGETDNGYNALLQRNGKGWARDPVTLEKRRKAGEEIWARVVASPEEYLRRLEVRYSIFAANRPIPSVYHRPGWRQLQAGPHWQLWEWKDPAPPLK